MLSDNLHVSHCKQYKVDSSKVGYICCSVCWQFDHVSPSVCLSAVYPEALSR